MHFNAPLLIHLDMAAATMCTCLWFAQNSCVVTRDEICREMITKVVQLRPNKTMYDRAVANYEIESFSKPPRGYTTDYHVDPHYREEDWDDW